MANDFASMLTGGLSKSYDPKDEREHYDQGHDNASKQK